MLCVCEGREGGGGGKYSSFFFLPTASILAFNLGAPGTCVGVHNRNPLLARHGVQEAFLGAVVRGARQPGQPE